MLIEEHKRIETLIKNKIRDLEADDGNEKELKKFNALYRLITNQYNTFFSKLDINIALQILKDIGIAEESLIGTYKKIMQEEIGPKYILMDIDLKDKEER